MSAVDGTGAPSLSLRRRLTGQIVLVIVALVVTFSAAVLLAIVGHLYVDARDDAVTIARNLQSQAVGRLVPLVHAYSRSTDPMIWTYDGRRLTARSPNAPAAPPAPKTSGLIWSRPPVYQWQTTHKGQRLTVDWPLGSDLSLLGGLALVVLVVTIAGAAAAVVVARWTTTRVLEPVRAMTDTVQDMLDTERLRSLSPPSGHDELSSLAGLLDRLLARLEDRHRQERQFLQDAAHQLQTPLEVIRGNLDIVRTWDALPAATRTRCLDTMDRTVTETAHLVRQLLVLERAAASSGVELAPLSLAALVEEVGEDAAALATDRPVSVTWEAPSPSLPADVAAADEFARRALWAVTENALKYTPRGGGHITLRVVDDGERNYRGIQVADDGPGIPPDELPHVVTRFFRGAANAGTGGTGLGLALADALMRAQRGRLDIGSPQDGSVGTVVTLWFCRWPAPPEGPTAWPGRAPTRDAGTRG